MACVGKLDISSAGLVGVIYDKSEVANSVGSGVVNVAFDGYGVTCSIVKTYMSNSHASSIDTVAEKTWCCCSVIIGVKRPSLRPGVRLKTIGSILWVGFSLGYARSVLLAVGQGLGARCVPYRIEFTWKDISRGELTEIFRARE